MPRINVLLSSYEKRNILNAEITSGASLLFHKLKDNDYSTILCLQERLLSEKFSLNIAVQNGLSIAHFSDQKKQCHI